MPSFNDAKRLYGRDPTIGQQIKSMSDEVMEETWDSNIQSKLCYIYDWQHDEHPELAENIPHDIDTKKTPIDAKFIITKYWTISSDQPEYHLEFKPSQKFEFKQGEPLYYYETDYRQKYGMKFPIGMYIDIPDESGNYEKWLIYGHHGGNQFTKYSILKCDYYLHWIEYDENVRYKRKLWCVLRSQSSYNSGLWTNYTSTLPENQTMLALPLNSITEKLFYINNVNGKNQRIIVSAPVERPLVWQISKVGTTNPLGIQIITGYQDQWNQETDYIDKEEQATGDLFAMYADYYSSTVIPVEPSKYASFHLNLKCNTNTIKAGGSYKLITANLYDGFNNEITNEITETHWTCSLNDEDITSDDELITWLNQDDTNKIKIKFGKNRQHYTEILKIQCVAKAREKEFTGEIQLEIIAL